MKQGLVLFLIAMNLIGCLDIFKSDEKHIVGNISVIDSNDEEGGRFKLILYNQKEQFNENILADYVVNVIGNDSVLLVNAITPASCNKAYYKIKHKQGKSIISLSKLDSLSYLINRNELKFGIYKFETNRMICP